MRKKRQAKKSASRTPKTKDLWKNPSYRNMVNPYESKYPQAKKKK
ncbi:MAG TPA: hypothetical protein VMV05_11995 [bacterium]|nr:hypothetical protein [bacterium]